MIHPANILRACALAAIVMMANGCHQKGCMDKNALNYNVTADQEDGSCIVCSSSTGIYSSKSVNLIDDNYYSQYYNQVIGRVDFLQPRTTFNYEQCGKSSWEVDMSVVNLINKNFTIDFYISQYSGPIYISSSSHTITVHKNETYSIGSVANSGFTSLYPISADSLRPNIYDVNYF